MSEPEMWLNGICGNGGCGLPLVERGDGALWCWRCEEDGPILVSEGVRLRTGPGAPPGDPGVLAAGLDVGPKDALVIEARLRHDDQGQVEIVESIVTVIPAGLEPGQPG